MSESFAADLKNGAAPGSVAKNQVLDCGAKHGHFQFGWHVLRDRNTCPHRGGPLAEGMLAGEEVICPWHGSRFNVKTGAVLIPPARQGVKSFPVRVTGDDVEVEME